MNGAPEAFADALLRWFDAHGRQDLPWQKHLSPYRVWISEVMLQQTQVAAVIPYYLRFMARFPDVQTLAAAPLDEVMHLWTGLGYYARARNVHACACRIVTTRGGQFPQDIDGMTSLPGIGRSTAGAILAIATGQRHAILDGNVKRVLARVFAVEGDPSSTPVLNRLWAHAEACTPATRTADYTQAIMDLGATVCTRSKPACIVCPMNVRCLAAAQGRQRELPGQKPRRHRPTREMTLLIARTQNRNAAAVYVEKRPVSGIWGGLWSPPQFETETAALQWCRQSLGEIGRNIMPLETIEHAFTHFDLRLKPLQVTYDRPDAIKAGDRLWYSLRHPPRIGLPQPIKQLFEQLSAQAVDEVE